MPFLPENYEKPETNSKYYKFKSGDNIFRILSEAIVGYVDWKDKKPIRTEEKPERSIDPKRPYKHFWAFVIWDYRDEAIKILEITQSTIQDAIFNFHSNKNWGDPKGYDLNIHRVGEEMDTKYTVIPTPPKTLPIEIEKLYLETPIDLMELYKGDDPFNPKSDNKEKEMESDIENAPF